MTDRIELEMVMVPFVLLRKELVFRQIGMVEGINSTIRLPIGRHSEVNSLICVCVVLYVYNMKLKKGMGWEGGDILIGHENKNMI
jgi:hypothetical protein